MHLRFYFISAGTLVPRISGFFLRLFLFIYVKAYSFILKSLPFAFSSNPYLSQETYKCLCTYHFNGTLSPDLYSHQVIFVPFHLRYCILEYLHLFPFPVTLITTGNDSSFDLPKTLIDYQSKLSKWFVQNNCSPSQKCVSLPIGLEDRWRHNHGNINDFNRLRPLSLNSDRDPVILYSFTIQNNINVRFSALQTLSTHPNAIPLKSPDPWSYRRSLLNVMFVASPAGNGIDCHRTWEALYLRCIPIVVSHEFYSRFPDFPGLILESWEELHSYNTSRLIEVYKHCLARLERCQSLWFPYWQYKVLNHQVSLAD
jgi:hypothetical protein